VESGIAIIVHPENPTKSMDKIEAKIYYLRIVRGTWKESKFPIRPANYSVNIPVKTSFLKHVLRMNNQQMMAYFKSKETSESLPVPPEFSSEEEVVNYVMVNKGAIGYISLESARKFNGIKVVLEIK
jgi:ABC-type phosphate transport system substrate-binding protein